MPNASPTALGPLALLDVNPWKDYFRSDTPPLLEARDRLRTAVSRGLVRPMLSVGSVSELAGASEPEGHPRYTEMMLFAWGACEGRCYDCAVDDEEARAARARDRASWPIRTVVLAEEGRSPLEAGSPAQLVASVWAITLDAWASSRAPLPSYRRADMPGRVIRRDG